MSLFRSICSPLRVATLALITVGAVSPVKAAVYTDYMLQLDAIYSQPNFGSSPIYFRFDPIINLISSLVTINSEADFDALGALGKPSPIVSMFFVDDINFCGGTADVSIDGCGTTPGSVLAFESGVGAGVVGHELGHDFGLQHDNVDPNNLMNANSTETDLTLEPFQVTTILASELIQLDNLGNRFVEVQPYVLVAPSDVAVPEPSTYLLVGVGLGIVALRARSKNNVKSLVS